MVSMGCDPYAKVGKLAFYRELDEHKRHLASVGVQREAIQEIEMQIDSNNRAGAKESKKIKKRTEVLAE